MTASMVIGMALSAAAGCGGSGVQQQQQPLSRARVDGHRSLSSLTIPEKGRLADRRIFFGHQSVGSNIMEGVAALAREDPSLGIRVVDLAGAPAVAGGFFGHGKVGQNGQPAGKTDDFASKVDRDLAGRVDVALHKYCYIDIDDRSDASALFAHYRDTMAGLRRQHPEVTFVHVTAPLTHVQAGPKVLVKRLIGRAPGGYLDNLRREQFNELMRREFAGREPLFDLAAIEATRPDGSEERFAWKGQTGRALHPAYGSDGRHLNDEGRRRVAEELIVMLATLPEAAGAEAAR
jgi:hypothetical protein